MSRKARVSVVVSLLSISIAAVSLTSWRSYRAVVVTAATEECETCSENYFDCRVNIPQCVETKVAQCRRDYGDETTCENGRPSFELQCSNECYDAFVSCWNLCSPGSGAPSQDYANGDCGGSPVASGQIDGTGQVSGGVFKNVYYIQYDGFAVSFYVDGNAAEVQQAGSAFAYPAGSQGSFSFVWSVPAQYRDGQTHSLYGYVHDSCGHSSFMVPFDGFPNPIGTFNLQP